MSMFKPETSITGFGDKVIVLTQDGFAFGTYTGNSRDTSESYEIRTEDTLTGEKSTGWYHKEDIYQSNEDNLERVREITG